MHLRDKADSAVIVQLDETASPLGNMADAAALRRRRRVFLALNVVTIAALFAGMAYLLALGGLYFLEGLMLFAYAATLPWLSIGFWNGVIGFTIAFRAKNAAAYVNPAVSREQAGASINSRVAIVMAIRHEQVDAFVARLEGMHQDIAQSGYAAYFNFHVLSDSADADIADAEEAAIADWRRRAPKSVAIHYRRRTDNTGFKAGNIEEFCDRCRDDYDFFIPLDADSRMTADAILRLVRIMEASPEIGILQGLVVGEASDALFTRIFQFGMRHGMRSYTLGAAWWQGDCGPFWGHNAVIRMRPFQQHCKMPVLSGKGPLSGYVLSHDQLEAAMMRKAGYEVRVLAEEDGSFEMNPPNLIEFIKRESRWCQGNMQYLKVLGMPGLQLTSRLQLVLAILMYVNAPAWILFITVGATMAIATTQFGAIPLALGLGQFAIVMAFNLMPKIMGVAQSLSCNRSSRSYGGRLRIAAGAVVEFAFSMLIAPCVAVAVSLCCLGLLFGSRIRWPAQRRQSAYLGFVEASRTLWPQTLYGLTLTAILAVFAPWALIFGVLIVGPLTFAIPLASLSTLTGVGRWTKTAGLFNVPEEVLPPAARQRQLSAA